MLASTKGGENVKIAFQTITEHLVLWCESSMYYYIVVLGLQVERLVNTNGSKLSQQMFEVVPYRTFVISTKYCIFDPLNLYLLST
jgi:hypothetical protein